MMFTIPGALLLAAVDAAFSNDVRSPRTLDSSIVLVGFVAGGLMLFLIVGNETYFPPARLGAFYGVTTAVFFVLFQRLLSPRRREPSGSRGERA